MDVSESKCNIVNKNSSQSDSSDVPTNDISALNFDDHIEPSANVKEASYFNIFGCGRNLLDQLGVTYQRAFTASETLSTVPTGHYISPSQERYWDIASLILFLSIPTAFSVRRFACIPQYLYRDEDIQCPVIGAFDNVSDAVGTVGDV